MAKKVMVAMSGGVDSSVAATLLVDQGYEVCGATMKLFSNELIGLDRESRACCSIADVEDARSVAYMLGFEHYVFNFCDCFQAEVINRFANSYLSGETPNPCIECNRHIKFGKLLERALLLNMDCIATGHYARVEFDKESGRYLLKKARDRTKDQTYVLYSMTQEQLKRTIFPLGRLLKSEARSLAEARGLVNSKKPDSQDICFVPDGDYAAFLENALHVRPCPGSIIDGRGNILGAHRGIIRYTVGQRKGLNLSFGKPKYVIKKDAASNTVVVGDECELYNAQLMVRDVNLISMERLSEPIEATVKTRHSQRESPAVLYPMDNGQIRVEFFEPQRAATPGQAAVFYRDDVVIGGGTII